MTEPIYGLQGVCVDLKGHTVLSQLDLTIPEGTTGIVGLNGAGKSTLLDVLAGFRSPTRGTIDRKYKKIGYLPQEFPIPRSIKVRDLIGHALWLRGFNGAEIEVKSRNVISNFALEKIENNRVGALSGGTQHRVAMAAATAHDPDLLILDEPTTGLDIEMRSLVRDLVAEQATKRSIVMTSHLAEDIERLCSHVIVLAKGNAVFQGTLDELQRKACVQNLEAAVLMLSSNETGQRVV